MELTYAASFDFENIRNWSGLGVYYKKMLREAGIDLNCLNLYKRRYSNQLIHAVKEKIDLHILRKKITPIYTIEQSRSFCEVINKELSPGNYLLSPNTAILAFVRQDIKKILYTDSTLANLLNFYPNYLSLTENAIAEAQEIELNAIQNADLLIYTSQWAADSAIRDYNADPKKVHIVPFGANLECAPALKNYKSILKKRNIQEQVNLLFIGVDWERKGGNIAVGVLELLRQRSINAVLHVAGLKELPKTINKEFIIDHGFLSKQSVDGENKLCNLIANCDFLILPSLADCTPVVFSEANAFGVPCLASDVGGHTTVIKNGINGKTFELENFVSGAADFITEIIHKENAYQELSYSSFKEYSNRLNWKTSGKKIANLIKQI